MRRDGSTAVRPCRHRAGARGAATFTRGGFTLIELVVAMAIFGVIAATLTVFFRPAFESGWRAGRAPNWSRWPVRRCSGCASDVRATVPNAIRTPGTDCIETLPTSSGGRYRRAADTVNDSGPGCTPGAACAAPLDTTQATTVFDVLTPLSTVPAVGDFVVVDNQSPGDVYGGSNRAAITAVAMPTAAYGRHRIGGGEHRVPARLRRRPFRRRAGAQRAVFYVCSGADGTLDGRGDGKGTLYRLRITASTPPTRRRARRPPAARCWRRTCAAAVSSTTRTRARRSRTASSRCRSNWRATAKRPASSSAPTSSTRHDASRRPQRGLGAITIIVVLVVLAGMAAAIVRLNAASPVDRGAEGDGRARSAGRSRRSAMGAVPGVQGQLDDLQRRLPARSTCAARTACG